MSTTQQQHQAPRFITTDAFSGLGSKSYSHSNLQHSTSNVNIYQQYVSNFNNYNNNSNSNIQDNLSKLIEYLETYHRWQQQSPATHDIIKQQCNIDITDNTLIQQYRNHDKIVVENIDNNNNAKLYLLSYRPYYPYYKTKDDLLKLIYDTPLGVDTSNLLDSYIGAADDLVTLYDNKQIVVLVGNRRDRTKQVQAISQQQLNKNNNSTTTTTSQQQQQKDNVIDNEPSGDNIVDQQQQLHSSDITEQQQQEQSSYIHHILRGGSKGNKQIPSRCYYRDSSAYVDTDLRELYHSIKLPSDETELERALYSAGYLDSNELAKGYVDKTRRINIQRRIKQNIQQDQLKRKRQEERNKNKKQTVFRKNQKITNAHLINQLSWLQNALDK